MGDVLLGLGQNPIARRVVKALGLPIPIPQRLARTSAPWDERPLEGKNLLFGAAPGGTLADATAEALAAAGAVANVVTADDTLAAPFREAGQRHGRPARFFVPTSVPHEVKLDGLVFDGSGISDPPALRALFETTHAWIGKLSGSGRVVILGRPTDGETRPARAAAQAALDGFVRSLGKEIGRAGSTAQLVQVEAGAEARLDGVLRFLLSPRAAFVSGQRIRVSALAATPSGADGSQPNRQRSLEGKVALVTGAARGIGAATARLLFAEGARVIALDRPADAEPLAEVVRAVNGMALTIDVTDPAAPATIADRVRQEHGALDIVIHNAGVTRDKTLARMSAELWDQAVDINLGAVVPITEALLVGGIRDGGRIICLSSVAGIAGNVGQTNYSASKAGIIGFVTCLAPQLAARGITVNAVAPGFIETRLTAAIPFAIREAGRRLSSLAQGGQPEDVGQALTFLSMPASQGITGSVLRVCGGAFIGA